MAMLLAETGFDFRTLNVNRVLEEAIGYDLMEDADVEVYGEIISDFCMIFWNDGIYGSLFGGSDIDVDDGFIEDGTITAYADLYYSGGDWWTMWELTDISVSASAILDVAETSATDDDRHLFREILAGDDYMRLSDYKDVTSGFGGADWIEGLEGSDRLYGGVGHDFVDGGAGHDRLSGGAGNDDVRGRSGRDRIVLDEGNDRLDGGTELDWLIVNGNKAARVDLARQDTQRTGYGRDQIFDIENVSGSHRGDRLIGNAEANRLDGNRGYDKLRGRSGDDRLDGGNGNDRLSGGNGDDLLLGGDGSDVLLGGRGCDVMRAGRDEDRDRFVFRSVDDSVRGAERDRLHGFDSGEDVINLRAIDADGGRKGNQAFAFSDDGRDANAVWQVDKGSHVLLRGDVDGDARADFELLVRNVDVLMDIDMIL